MLWLVGAVLIGLVVPCTLVIIQPTNNPLIAPGRDLASADIWALLEKWDRLHTVRSLLSLGATLWYLVLLLKT